MNDNVNHNAAAGDGGGGLERIYEKLDGIKKWIALVVSLGTGTVWVINYFATQDALNKLDSRVECEIRLNANSSKTSSDINLHKQSLSDEKISKQKDERILKILKKSQESGDNNNEIESTQDRITQSESKIKNEENTIHSLEEKYEKATKMLIEHTCSIEDRSKEIMSEIELGKF